MSDDTKYPVLVARWDDKHPADAAICTRCGREARWDPAEGDPYDMCVRCSATGSRWPGGVCGGQIVMKYDAGESCPNCSKLAYSMPKGLGGCCSRRCMLQHEYAMTLSQGAQTA